MVIKELTQHMTLSRDVFGNVYGEEPRNRRNPAVAVAYSGLPGLLQHSIGNIANVPSVITGFSRPGSNWGQSVRGSHLPARGDVLTRRAFTNDGTVSSPSVDRPGPRQSPVVFGQGVLGNIMKSFGRSQGPIWKIWLFKFLNPGGE